MSRPSCSLSLNRWNYITWRVEIRNCASSGNECIAHFRPHQTSSRNRIWKTKCRCRQASTQPQTSVIFVETDLLVCSSSQRSEQSQKLLWFNLTTIPLTNLGINMQLSKWVRFCIAWLNFDCFVCITMALGIWSIPVHSFQTEMTE